MADAKLSHYTPRRIKQIKFKKFKNLDGLEIDFTGHNVTCLFGCNGVGKATDPEFIMNHIQKNGDSAQAKESLVKIKEFFGV